jgi:hypothetical protein
MNVRYLHRLFVFVLLLQPSEVPHCVWRYQGMSSSSATPTFSETEAPSIPTDSSVRAVSSPPPGPTSTPPRGKKKQPASASPTPLRIVNHFCSVETCEHHDHNSPVTPRKMLEQGMRIVCPKGHGPTLVQATSSGLPPWYGSDLNATSALFQQTFPQR